MHRANRPVTLQRQTTQTLQQRPSGRLLLALACSLALQQLPGVAMAAETAAAQQQAQHTFAIAAGPLAPALRNLSSSANLLLSFTAEQTAYKVTAGIQGNFTVVTIVAPSALKSDEEAAATPAAVAEGAVPAEGAAAIAP